MSNKLFLYFREFNLGELQFFSNTYFWLPNIENIKSAQQKCPVAMGLFYLPSENKMFKKVPYHFNSYLISAGREDLKEKAKINETDSDFEKLLKLSSLDFYNQDFVIKNN